MNERQEAGASAVEYGLIVFAIAAVIALVLYAFGRVVSETYEDGCSSLANKAGTTATC